jgi:carnitine 3-dehydrogenase
VVIASSTSGLMPSDLQKSMVAPERFLVAHPFNPVYLLPLVELVGGSQTSASAVEAARTFFTRIGMHPLLVRKEVPGHLTDRLQEALWREILHMVNDGVATTGELDESIVYGPGLRWAAMGTNMIYHLAGGETGMRHMLAQFGPCLKWPWTRLEAPELSETLIDRMVEGTQAQAAGRSIRELERLRDDCLVAIQQVLRQYDIGAGSTLRALERRLYEQNATAGRERQSRMPQALGALQGTVRPEWVDYNGHMTDSRYQQVFGDAMDALYRDVGIDEAYRAAGHMFYTAESHATYHAELRAGDAYSVTTRILSIDEKRLHVFHELRRDVDHALVATGEQMHLHVDTRARRTAQIPASTHGRLRQLHDAVARDPWPAQAGRRIGQAPA